MFLFFTSIFFSPKQRTAALLSPDGHYRMFYLHLQPSCRPVARLSGCESNRGTITREIISSVLSGYAPCPVTSRLLCCPPTGHFSFSLLTHPCFCLFCLFLFFSGGVYVGWGGIKSARVFSLLGRVINGVRRVYFHFSRGEREEKMMSVCTATGL